MMNWLRSHVRAFGQAGRYINASALSSVLAIVAIGIALALPGAGFWLLDNIERLGRSLGETHEISIFLSSEAASADTAEIEKRLKNSSALRWRYVSREEALANLQKVEGLQGLAAGLPRNPLPDAFVVTPRDTSPRAMQDFAQHARTWPKVAIVQHDSAWATRYQAMLRLGRMGTVVLASILVIGLIAVTFNTIRLQIVSRRQEIEVALLIGATRNWVARPFLWFGLIEGLLGALFALFVLLSSHFLLAPLVSDIARSYDNATRLQAPARELLLGILVVGMALGWTGSWLSTRRTLPRLA
jgi:cell division transport system permease protein